MILTMIQSRILGKNKVPDPRDAVIDQAKIALAQFFEEEKTGVFYQRQLQIIFERDFFHWITARALAELVAENVIAASSEVLPNVGSIRIYWKSKHRYWKRQANEVIQIVSEFSRSDFAHAMGAHAEMMFDAALPSVGFTPTGREMRSYNGKVWTETNHDLDRVFERDGVGYGTEIKNTLDYIPREEMRIKVAMCGFLGLRPLFIVRMAPKNYVNEVQEAGGLTLIFKYQLYPFGQRLFAEKVREMLRLPIGCPDRIADGTCQRFLQWHVKHLP
jgi:hypothetical protein